MATATILTTATLDPDFVQAWKAERARASLRAAELERLAQGRGLTDAEMVEYRRCAATRDEGLAAYADRAGRNDHSGSNRP